MVSYIGPVRGYQSRKTELRAQQVTLSKLLKERDALRALSLIHISEPTRPY